MEAFEGLVEKVTDLTLVSHFSGTMAHLKHVHIQHSSDTILMRRGQRPSIRNTAERRKLHSMLSSGVLLQLYTTLYG